MKYDPIKNTSESVIKVLYYKWLILEDYIR